MTGGTYLQPVMRTFGNFVSGINFKGLHHQTFTVTWRENNTYRKAEINKTQIGMQLLMMVCAPEKDDMLVAWQRAKGQLRRKSEPQAGIEPTTCDRFLPWALISFSDWKSGIFHDARCFYPWWSHLKVTRCHPCLLNWSSEQTWIPNTYRKATINKNSD